MNVPNFRLNAALEYAARGWHIFPLHWPKLRSDGLARCSCGADCRSIGKHPLTATGFKEGSTDEATIRAWWAKWPTANIGLVTGRINGVVVLDIDVKSKGLESLAELEAVNGKLPATVEVISGSGGSHRYFRHPGETLSNSASAKSLGPGLDIRGDGGLIVVPPSLHASGERYAWELCAGPDEAELADIPEWLLNRIRKPIETPKPSKATSIPLNARKWLGDALARAGAGNRSETGHWLACQLRDNSVPRAEAEAIMRDYAVRVPAGDHPYTEREALATYASAIKTPARDPAQSTRPQTKVRVAPEVALNSPPPANAADELDKFTDGVIAGRIMNVPFPWPALTNATQALLPGSFCLLGGDPGVGKTFFILECLQFWHANEFNPAVFFAEKDLAFYVRRLVAQLEKNGKMLDLDWVRQHGEEVKRANDRHRTCANELGTRIWTKPPGRLTLDAMLGWMRDRAEAGHRVVVIDPITAIDPGAERWSKESDFVQSAQDLMREFGVSLLLTTHPKQASGRTGGTSSGHDAAGGAAYFRFVDSMIWLTQSKQPRRVEANHPIGGTRLVNARHFARLLKTRDGIGAGWELAYGFGHTLSFEEHGAVVKESKVRDDEPHDPFGAPPPKAPSAHALAMNHLDLDEEAA